MTKTIGTILILFGLNFQLTAQAYEYLVETTSLDSFMVIENGEERLIKSSRVDNTEFTFQCKDPTNTFIRMHCESCEVELTAKLFGIEEDGFTHWIKLGHKEKISVAECFKKYPEKTGLSALISNTLDKIQVFWNSFGNGRTARRRTPILKSGGPEPDDPKLEFLKTDYFYFLEKEMVAIPFRNFNNFPIKSIYIISHDGDLIFHAGDRDVLEDLFSLEGKTSPKVSDIVKQNNSNSKESLSEIKWERVENHLFSPLHPGQWYQFGIELEGDKSDHNPYLFNFQVYKADQLKELKKFFNRA